MARKKTTTSSSSKKSEIEIPQITNDFAIKDLKWTKKQLSFIETGVNESTNVIFCSAPAGVGKTILSLRVGLQLLKENKIEKIYFCRQPKESSLFGLGYVKGSIGEKMAPYSHPMFDNLNELMWQHQIPELTKNNDIEVIPIGFLKGRTFNNCLFIVDESEDLCFLDFRLCLTRIGRNSKMFFIGDSKQSNVKNNGFEEIYELFDTDKSKEHGIHCLKFHESDIMRNPIISYILEQMDNKDT